MINKKGQFSVLGREILLKAVALVIARSCWGGFSCNFSDLLLPVHETLHVVGGGSSRSMWPLSDLGNTCVQAKNVGGLESSAVV